MVEKKEEKRGRSSASWETRGVSIRSLKMSKQKFMCNTRFQRLLHLDWPYSRERENWHINDPPPRLRVHECMYLVALYELLDIKTNKKMNRVSHEGLKVRALLEVEPRGWTHFITIPAFNTKTITKKNSKNN